MEVQKYWGNSTIFNQEGNPKITGLDLRLYMRDLRVIESQSETRARSQISNTSYWIGNFLY